MSNIEIVQSPEFGHPDYATIQGFLEMVDRNMMAALNRPPHSTCRCVVLPKEEHPMCCKGSDGHVIYISAKDDYWCKWVYQFAHEYCHHLINGELSGAWSPLLWFEETVCELSSIYNLFLMEPYCIRVGLDYYAPAVHEYWNDLLTENEQTYPLSPDGGWLAQYESLLSAEGYQRDLYNAIAVQMFLMFVENPNLWKMILHIGEISQWDSLDELFDHLQACADSSYATSLRRLRLLFS